MHASSEAVSLFNIALSRVETHHAEWTETERHRHPASHVIYPARGQVQCEADGRIWMIPPHSALWIPGGTMHSVWAKGQVDCFAISLSPKLAEALPEICCVLHVSDLLKEVLMKTILIRDPYVQGSPTHRLMSVLVDELRSSPASVTQQLPLPQDPRLIELAKDLLAYSGTPRTMQDWARDVALSSRSLSRLLSKELGMGFSHWKRQLQVLSAVRRLSEGASVQAVAFETGFESASAFIAMFKKCMGQTPARYMDAHRTGKQPTDTRSPQSARACRAVPAR